MECASCEREVSNEHISASYPCGHAFHLKCLDTRESAYEYTVACPICPVPQQQQQTPLISAFYKTKRWLNVGDDIASLHRDIKIDVITVLVHRRYKSYNRALSQIRKSNSDADIDASGMAISAQSVENHIVQSDNNNNNSSFMSKLLPTNWLSQQQKEDSGLLSIEHKQEFKEFDEGLRSSLLEMINNHEDIVLMYYRGYTMRDAIIEDIKLNIMISNGYGLIDWLVLGATWTDLIALGLTPEMIEHYSRMMDISSLIEVYRLKFHDVFDTLCKKSLSRMAKLRLCKQDMINLGFSGKRLKKYGIEIDSFKSSSLWKTLIPSEWNELLEDTINNVI